MEMTTTSDVILRGTAWDKAVIAYSDIFKSRPYYNLFILSASIGIIYDIRLDKLPEEGEQPKTLPRNVIDNQERIDRRIDLMAQTAVLNSSTLDYSEEDRLQIAFDEQDKRIHALDLLQQFANFGVTKLVELIGATEIETMENLKDFLVMTAEGVNFDIDSISDEELAKSLGNEQIIN